MNTNVIPVTSPLKNWSSRVTTTASNALIAGLKMPKKLLSAASFMGGSGLGACSPGASSGFS
jgi:hypothetical protein